VPHPYGGDPLENLGQPLWVGHYRLTSRIATGGMAEVYVGRQISETGAFGPIVAVKKLLPHLVKDRSVVRMFLNEARITAQITHPNVVRIFELGQVDGEPFLAMELLEGRTFAELRARAADEGRRVPLAIALKVLAEACRGLGAAHEAKDDDGHPLALVHRDFTPDNVHVGVRGDVKVIDFGIARTANWGAGTEPGTLKGKFFYMSPEMILSRPVDHRADIFAAGVMLYEQLCGRRPFTGNSADEVVMRIAEGKVVPPSTFDPSLPASLEAVCLTALNHDPASRFQTMEGFIDAIDLAGPAAEVATSEDVAQYVSQLFPKEDHRRATLRRAREADPSNPHARPQDLGPTGPGEPSVPATTSPPAHAAHDSATERATPALGAREPKTPAVAKVPTSAPPTGQRSTLRLWVALGALLGLGLGAGAAVALGGGSSTAAELLREADQAQSPEAQAKALLALKGAADVSDGQLQRAGQLLVEHQQWAAGAELADAWVLRSPKNPDARLLEARAAIHLRKGKKAEAALGEATALAPDDARTDVVMAELRELQGDAAGAIEAWTRAAKKQPTDAHFSERLGAWLSRVGRLDEADQVLSALLRRQFVPEAAAELGFAKFRKDQADEALNLLSRALKEAPGLMVAHYYRATVLYRKGDLKGARAGYLEADALAGEDPRPLVALCELEQQQQAPPRLDEVKQKLKARFPAQAGALIAGCAP